MDEQPKLSPENVSPSSNVQIVKPPFHNKFPLIIPLTLLAIGLAIYAYLLINKTSSVSKPTAIQPVLPSPTKAPQFIGDYSMVVKLNRASPCNSNFYLDRCTSDIYFKDNQSGKEIFFLTTDDVIPKSNGGETVYRNGYVFLTKRTGNSTYPSNNWTDELWMYSDPHHGKMLFSQKGLTFNVNNTASLVAVFPLSIENTIQVIHLPQAQQTKTYSIDPSTCMPDLKVRGSINGLNLALMEWDKDNITYWGDFEGEFAFVGCFWKLNTLTSEITYFPVAKPEGFFDVNLEKMVALYIDKPPIVDVGSEQYWQATTRTYSLYLYNIRTQKSNVIDTFPSTYDFDATTTSWVSPTQFRYTSPSGEKTYTLSD